MQSAADVLSTIARHESKGKPLLGAALSMSAGGEAAHLERIHRAHASRSASGRTGRYGGKSWKEALSDKIAGLPPQQVRDRLRERFLYLRRRKVLTIDDTLESWCESEGFVLPPARNPELSARMAEIGSRNGPGASLEKNVKAAAAVEPWIAWILLIAGKALPPNPGDINSAVTGLRPTP